MDYYNYFDGYNPVPFFFHIFTYNSWSVAVLCGNVYDKGVLRRLATVFLNQGLL